MELGPFNPDSWMDILAYCILALPATIAAVATVRGQRKQRSMHRENRRIGQQTLDQVANTHESNLRDDIDALTDSIRDGFSDVRRDIGGLREELRTERVERIEGDRNHIIRGRG